MGMETEVKQKCFVIMPFSKTSEKHTEEYWTDHYAEFIKPLIESAHPLIAERSSPLRGDILRQIITDLVTASIVVADLTDANPNVYWELGVRQSFKHCTVTIAEDGTTLPFDLGVKGSLFYFPGDHIKMREFESNFRKAIDDCLNNPTSPDSYVLETISGRGTLYQILMRDEAIRKLDAIISEIERNELVLDVAVDICNENIQKRKKAVKKGKKAMRNTATGRFRHSAVETLIVTRYVDADKTFYDAAEKYMDELIRVNEQLSFWLAEPDALESWLIKHKKDFKSRIDSFREMVIKQKIQLENLIEHINRPITA
jgi:hypothetical protein